MKRFYDSKSTFSYFYPFTLYGDNTIIISPKSLENSDLNLNKTKSFQWIWLKIGMDV